jgi:ribonuclease HI
LIPLFDLAYKKERAAGKRLAKTTGISLETAISQVMQQSAGHQTLEQLAAQRRDERDRAAQRIAAKRQAKLAAHSAKLFAQAPDPSAWLAWFDGATHPNPGRMGIGGVLQSPSGATTEISFHAGDGDSSEAEYRALIAVLKAAVAVNARQLVVHGDSRVVIDDVQAPRGARVLAQWREQARGLIVQLPDVTLRWVPREKNAVADALSQRAVRTEV